MNTTETCKTVTTGHYTRVILNRKGSYNRNDRWLIIVSKSPIVIMLDVNSWEARAEVEAGRLAFCYRTTDKASATRHAKKMAESLVV